MSTLFIKFFIKLKAVTTFRPPDLFPLGPATCRRVVVGLDKVRRKSKKSGDYTAFTPISGIYEAGHDVTGKHFFLSTNEYCHLVLQTVSTIARKKCGHSLQSAFSMFLAVPI